MNWVLTDEHYQAIRKALEYSVEPGYDASMLDGATPISMSDSPPVLVDSEPMDLDFARAMCRSSGISLVSRDFIERFAYFVRAWKKGDFTLPKYAELDMQSCFDAWQAFDPDLATSPPSTEPENSNAA